ncbi:ABC transporter substrate-binding protein [Nitratireductor indicus]|uniref:Branched-chain amino acid ABC transporter periplasmic branched-chain amino acid binding protein n=1 Tax=Nitratireductor indicus C115 TaxID=1231190 RepID=K2N4X5_9HYPH|nr:ABC transporter substrate-binding protein [Nitratireductor indicus]EKF42453.1 branched-chain amino acid ABC transporter periplasmic branched-chain amino acid binding protein [Nitratireductor indicus C115]MDS1137942.1 ABC transporter substrate-binding protein [Nitratireductor indicus]SFQ56146.1 branched-chain amino acid transport system substrate-binding protein [Nitratireductor indicus]
MKALFKTAILSSALALGVGLAGPVAAQDDSIYIPNLAYRTGPFASTGTPLMNGQRDYIMMLNERDGGLNGVKLQYDECETGYNTEKGMECYEKTKARAVVTQPWSTGITLQVLPKSNVDKIPILAAGYGFSPMSDGKVFQWAYNPPSSYWDGASMILQNISGGDLASLKGKKIAFLHLDHPFGKEPLPLLEAMAKKHGFTLVPIPVGLTEMQNQSAQWLQIRRERPDFVIMWGWGAMNAGAITEAVKTKYPMNQFVGVWWSGHDGDMKLVGDAGKGYRSISWSVPNSESGLMQDIKKYVVDAGKSQINQGEGEFDSVFYQRGLMISLMLVEGIKVAQDHFDVRAPNPEQLRWGLENIKLDEARLKELGADGMLVPFSTSCSNHTGHGGGWILEWDGAKFVKASDLLQPDRAEIEPLELEKAKEYADANAPWPVNEECKM